MSPVESAGLVPAARGVMQNKLPLVVLDRDVPAEKTLFIGQSNVTMAEQVADWMSASLGWSPAERTFELERYLQSTANLPSS